MSQVKFKFMERLGTNLNLSNATIADGDMVNIALGKLQGQITNISTFQFSNSNGVTFGTNAGTVTASFSQSADTNKLGLGFTSAGNNIGLSATLNSNGLNLSATVPSQSVQTQNNIGGFSAGTTSQNSGTVVFSNSNNVSFGLNAGAVTASFNQTSDTNKAGTTFAGTNVSGTVNSNGINLSVANPGGGGASIGISAGTNSRSSGTVVFANSNNVSFGMDTNGQITAAGGGAISANGGIATGGTVVFANSNNVSFGMDTNGQITAAGGGAISANGGIATGGTVNFSNANNIVFGMNSNTITASAQAQSMRLIGNTLGVSSVSGNNIYLSGGDGVTISGTSNTIVISANGGGAAAQRYFIEINQGERLTTIRNLSETRFSNRPAFFPFWVEGTGIVPRTVRAFISGAASSNRSLGLTIDMGLYSQINSSEMSLLTTASIGYSLTNSSQSSIWNGIGVMDVTGMSGYTLTAEGRYMIGMHVSVVSANATWANVLMYGCDNYPNFAKVFVGNTTVATNKTNQLLPWQGVFSNTSPNLPSLVNITEVYGGNSASGMQPYMVILGI